MKQIYTLYKLSDYANRFFSANKAFNMANLKKYIEVDKKLSNYQVKFYRDYCLDFYKQYEISEVDFYKALRLGNRQYFIVSETVYCVEVYDFNKIY